MHAGTLNNSVRSCSVSMAASQPDTKKLDWELRRDSVQMVLTVRGCETGVTSFVWPDFSCWRQNRTRQWRSLCRETVIATACRMCSFDPDGSCPADCTVWVRSARSNVKTTGIPREGIRPGFHGTANSVSGELATGTYVRMSECQTGFLWSEW